jgi:hypothetical protein
MAKVPGATSAHSDTGGSPTGTRTAKTQRRGKLGTDDFNDSLDLSPRSLPPSGPPGYSPLSVCCLPQLSQVRPFSAALRAAASA